MHSEFFPGNDGLNSGLGGIESVTGSFVDMISHCIVRGKLMLAMSTHRSTFKGIS